MNSLLTRAQELLDLGIKAEKRGLYTFASIRYVQIWESLFSLVTLRENNLISLTPREETVIFNVFHMIKTRMRDLTAKMTDGSASMSGRKDHDSAREAFGTILREMEEFM